MLKKSGKLAVAISLATAIMVGSSLSAFASNSVSTATPYSVGQQQVQVHTNQLSPEATLATDGDMETQGIKKWIAKQAMQAASWALRNGGALIDDIAEELGGKEATYFTKHTDTIADELDYLSAQAEVVEDAIIDGISTALISVGVPSGSARTIAAVFTFLAF